LDDETGLSAVSLQEMEGLQPMLETSSGEERSC